MKSSSALFKWPKNWRAPRPPPTLIILPKLTDQNSEIAILFSVVENFITMSLGTTYSPTVPMGGATSYKLWPMLTYSNGYWEVYRRFQEDFFGWGRGWEEGGMLGELSFDNLSWGKKISMKGAQDLLALFQKNNEKINMKKFFQLEVRNNIKT